MPPIMLGSMAGAGAAGSGLLATTASVVKIKLATDAAFWRAERLTFTGSMIPSSIMLTHSPVATGEWVNMIEEGIIDPVKVSRSALQNAASVASLILTTEAVVANKPEPAAPAPAMDPSMMGGMM